MIEREFVLRWRLGARASISVASRAKGFQSKIKACHGGLVVDAKEMLGLMLLGPNERGADGNYPGPLPGTTIKITVDGPDEKQAMESMAQLLEAPDWS